MKKLIIKYHLLDMVERTNSLHYENYRSSKLDSIEDCNSKPKRYLIISSINFIRKQISLFAIESSMSG